MAMFAGRCAAECAAASHMLMISSGWLGSSSSCQQLYPGVQKQHADSHPLLGCGYGSLWGQSLSLSSLKNSQLGSTVSSRRCGGSRRKRKRRRDFGCCVAAITALDSFFVPLADVVRFLGEEGHLGAFKFFYLFSCCCCSHSLCSFESIVGVFACLFVFSPPSFLMLLEENWTGWGFVGCCWRDG